MNRLRVWLTGALAAIVAVATVGASGATVSTAFEPSAEHARLIAMCGTWDVEMVLWFQPGRPPVASKGTSTIEPLLGGLFIQEKIASSYLSFGAAPEWKAVEIKYTPRAK